MGFVPFNVRLGNRGGCGRFSSPLRRAGAIQPGACETVGVRAIFIAPTKGVFHSSGCSESGRGCTVQSEIVSKWVQKSVQVHCSMGVLNIQLEIYFFQWKV